MPKLTIVIEGYNNSIEVCVNDKKLQLDQLSLNSRAVMTEKYQDEEQLLIHISNNNLLKSFTWRFWVSFILGVPEYTLKDVRNNIVRNNLTYKMKMTDDIVLTFNNTSKGILLCKYNVDLELIDNKTEKVQAKKYKNHIIIPVFCIMCVLLLLLFIPFIYTLVCKAYLYSISFGGAFILLLLAFIYGIKKTFND